MSSFEPALETASFVSRLETWHPYLIQFYTTSRAMIFIANSEDKSSKFRGKSKKFRKILMPTDLNLVILKSLGSRAHFAHSWLRQRLTVIILKKHQIM